MRVQGVCPEFRRATEGGRIFEVTSPRLWNSIPVEWVKKIHLTHLKTAFQKHILHKYINVN